MKFIPVIFTSCLVLFTSCKGGGSKKIGTAEGAQFAKSKIEKVMKPTDDIMRITLTGEEDGANIQAISVYAADPSLEKEVRFKMINLLNETLSQDNKKPLMFAVAKGGINATTAGNTRKLADFDFAKMPDQIEAAKKMLPEEYSYFGVASYDLYGGKEMPYKFTLNATRKGESKERKNKMIITNYYQFNFEVDGSGKLVMLEE